MFLDLNKPVYVKMFGKCAQENGFWHKEYLMKSHLFMYIIDGNLNMKISNNIYHVSPGDVLLIPANTIYQPLECDGCSYYFFHFTAFTTDKNQSPSMKDILSSFKEHEPKDGYIYSYSDSNINYSIIEVPIHIKYNSNNKINEILNRAIKLNIWQNIGEKLILDNIMRELLISTSTMLANNKTTNNTLQKILLYINEHYYEPLTLTNISDTFGISKSYTTRLFKTYLGIGTVDYINNLRLSIACEFLISSNYTILEISNKVGFNNPYYFDRCFRNKYGITPKEFRKTRYILRP